MPYLLASERHPEHPCIVCGEPTTNKTACGRKCSGKHAAANSPGRKHYERIPIETRFLYQILCGLHENDCWTWLSFYSTQDYPMVWDTEHRRQIPAMRMSWEMFRGPLPKGHVVGNTCETKGCCNPKHLRSGTHGEVVGRRLRLNQKSRRYGDEHASTKLPDADLPKIRQLHSERKFKEIKALAPTYGMNPEYLVFLGRPNKSRKRKGSTQTSRR